MDEILSVTIQMKAVEQYLTVTLFFKLYNIVLRTECEDPKS